MSKISQTALLDLPAELLIKICQYVYNIHRPSLAYLSKTCQGLNTLALPILYRSISITLGWQRLEKLVKLTLRDKRNFSILATLRRLPYLWKSISKLEIIIHSIACRKVLPDVETEAVHILRHVTPKEVTIDGKLTPTILQSLPLRHIEKLTVQGSWTPVILDHLLLSDNDGPLRDLSFLQFGSLPSTRRILTQAPLVRIQLRSLHISLTDYDDHLSSVVHETVAWAGSLRRLVLSVPDFWQLIPSYDVTRTSNIQKILNLHQTTLEDIELDFYHPDSSGRSVDLSHFSQLRALRTHCENLFKLGPRELCTKLPVCLRQLQIGVESIVPEDTYHVDLKESDMLYLLELASHMGTSDLRQMSFVHNPQSHFYNSRVTALKAALKLVQSFVTRFQELKIQLMWRGVDVSSIDLDTLDEYGEPMFLHTWT